MNTIKFIFNRKPFESKIETKIAIINYLAHKYRKSTTLIKE